MPGPDTDPSKSRLGYWRGYPERYRELYRTGAKRAVVAIALLVLVPSGGAFAWFMGSAWAPLKVLFGCLLLAIGAYGAVVCTRTVRGVLFARTIPYFEKRLGDGPAFSGGAALAKNTQRLDTLALTAGVAPLSSFGFNDDSVGETVTWHEPALALATIRTISQHIPHSELELRHDLDLLAESLNLAASHRTRFALLLTTTYAPNDAGNERRLGFFS